MAVMETSIGSYGVFGKDSQGSLGFQGQEGEGSSGDDTYDALTDGWKVQTRKVLFGWT